MHSSKITFDALSASSEQQAAIALTVFLDTENIEDTNSIISYLEFFGADGSSEVLFDIRDEITKTMHIIDDKVNFETQKS